MFVILVTTVPFYGVKEHISPGTVQGQTIEDFVDLRDSAFDNQEEDNEDTAGQKGHNVTISLLLYLYATPGHFQVNAMKKKQNSLGANACFCAVWNML